MPNDRPANPVIVSRGRPWREDLSVPVLQRARETGIAVRQGNINVEHAAAGISDDKILALVDAIKKNTDIELSLKVLKVGFIGRVIPLIVGIPAQIIPTSKWPRGYIIINPGETTGFSVTITPFTSLLRIPGTYTSASFNVSGVNTARFFLNVTVQAAGATLIINAQTQDPTSGNWATSQSDIFSGAAAVGTYYASMGPLGVDRNLRLQAIVGVNNETFSIGGILKGGTLTPVGTTVYIGGPDVNTTIGYPLLPTQREYFYLGDNVSLYAISPTEPMILKVFQLQ